MRKWLRLLLLSMGVCSKCKHDKPCFVYYSINSYDINVAQ